MALREEGFWDRHYEEELRNFDDAHDEGEVWFGRSLSRKIVSRMIEVLASDSSYQDEDMINIVDIGCGNSFLITLLSQGIENQLPKELARKCRILGLDYSLNSIELSKKVVEHKDLSGKAIQLNHCDFLDKEQLKKITSGKLYRFLIDVGTFDAICLLASESKEKLYEVRRKYVESVYSIVQQGSVFIFASCNHTQDELMSLFELDCPHKQSANLIGTIETAKLKFGGREGSQVCCLILKF